MEKEKKQFEVNMKVGVWGWLFLIMFVLKLNPGGHLDSAVTGWSWWVVWAPIWVRPAILGAVAIIAFVLEEVGLARKRSKLKKELAQAAAEREARRQAAWNKLNPPGSE